MGKNRTRERQTEEGERRFSLSRRTKDEPIMETPFHELTGRFIFSLLSMKLGEGVGGMGGGWTWRSVFKKGAKRGGMSVN